MVYFLEVLKVHDVAYTCNNPCEPHRLLTCISNLMFEANTTIWSLRNFMQLSKTFNLPTTTWLQLFKVCFYQWHPPSFFKLNKFSHFGIRNQFIILQVEVLISILLLLINLVFQTSLKRILCYRMYHQIDMLWIIEVIVLKNLNLSFFLNLYVLDELKGIKLVCTKIKNLTLDWFKVACRMFLESS